jgi:uncharacterized protein YjiS (DUF1127 family)
MDGFDKVIGDYSKPGVKRARFAGDEGIEATFYRGRSPLELTEDEAEEYVAAGKPTYTECDFLRMTFPGDRSKVYDQPVKNADKRRFAAEWAAYQEGNATLSGTPLSAWSALTGPDVRKFEALNIRTVEALAEVLDGNLSGLGLGGAEARTAARKFLLEREAGAPARVSDEVAMLRETVARLEAQAQQDKPRRGRPPLEDKEAA